MRRNLVIMYAISFLQGMVFYSSIATLYRQAEGLTVFQITLIESISLVLSLVCELPWGIIADRIGYRRTMIVCNVLYFVSKLVFWKAEGFGDFLAERILLAVVISGLSGVDSSVVYLSCRDGESQKAFGFFESLGTAGLLSSAAIYTIFIGEDYKLAGLMTAISYGIAMIVSFALKEVKPEDTGEKPTLRHSLDILKNTLLNKQLLLLIIAIGFILEVNQSIVIFFSQLQYIQAGIPVRLISVIYIIVNISALVSVFSAPLTKKLSAKTAGLIFFIISGLSCLALALTYNPFISVLGILLISMSFRLMSPLGNDLQNKVILEKDRATALSMGSLIMDLLAVFTNLIFGKLADFDLRSAMLFGFVLCAAGGVMYLISFAIPHRKTQ